MDSYFADLQRVVIKLERFNLFKNKLTTLFYFSFLMLAVFFIQLHPHSVWYYFIAGVFSCRMIGLVIKKTNIKYRIDEHMNRLIQMGYKP